MPVRHLLLSSILLSLENNVCKYFHRQISKYIRIIDLPNVEELPPLETISIQEPIKAEVVENEKQKYILHKAEVFGKPIHNEEVIKKIFDQDRVSNSQKNIDMLQLLDSDEEKDPDHNKNDGIVCLTDQFDGFLEFQNDMAEQAAMDDNDDLIQDDATLGTAGYSMNTIEKIRFKNDLIDTNALANKRKSKKAGKEFYIPNSVSSILIDGDVGIISLNEKLELKAPAKQSKQDKPIDSKKRSSTVKKVNNNKNLGVQFPADFALEGRPATAEQMGDSPVKPASHNYNGVEKNKDESNNNSPISIPSKSRQTGNNSPRSIPSKSIETGNNSPRLIPSKSQETKVNTSIVGGPNLLALRAANSPLVSSGSRNGSRQGSRTPSIESLTTPLNLSPRIENAIDIEEKNESLRLYRENEKKNQVEKLINDLENTLGGNKEINLSAKEYDDADTENNGKLHINGTRKFYLEIKEVKEESNTMRDQIDRAAAKAILDEGHLAVSLQIAAKARLAGKNKEKEQEILRQESINDKIKKEKDLYEKLEKLKSKK